MKKNKTSVIFILTLYIFSTFAPLTAYAQQTGTAAAVQAAADALSMGSSGTGNGVGFPGDSDTDTGISSGSENTADVPDIQDQTSTEPIVVQEKINNDDVNLGTISTLDSSVSTSPRLDPREVKGSSMFNNMRSQLARFGADFFRTKRTSSLTYAPVGPNYVVAPGDEVKINLWGFSEIRANLIVDRDGTLTLPQAGPVSAAGLTFTQLQKSIDNAYRRILNDFELNVTMGKLHTITVYVTGHAAQPGAYAISSMATLVDVLSQAGGPSLSGSMRAIEVKRNNKKIAVFDVYNLLLKGDRTGDSRLADGDVIFIPTVGPLVAVAGNVKQPAVYEIKSKENKLNDVISLAGGLTAGAYKGRIQLVRVEHNTFRTAFESDLNSPAANVQILKDGDLLKIFAVPGGAYNVRIAGAVVQPGVYPIVDGVTTLTEILNRAGGLLYTAASEGELTRVEVSPEGPVTTRINLNLKEAEKGTSRFILNRDDYLFVRTVPDWNIYRSANITGRVLYPGNYAVQRGEKLSSLLERSGGYASDAFTRGTVFLRESVRTEQQKQIDTMIKTLEKEIVYAGNEAIATSTGTNDVTYAKESMAMKNRYLAAVKDIKATGRLVIKLPEDYRMLKGSPYDITLEEGDRLYIPDKPGTVQVIGSVLTPAAFVYREGQPFNSYVKMAGGYSTSASPKRTYIMKAAGSTIRALAGNKPRIVEEGDFIVVPEKVQFSSSMRNTMNIVDIIYKFALGVAAVNNITK
ncbi:MAG: polysaccharide export protein [Synergistaceae bacterium]|nr:polysaccharide export protein [Synergistaceae bacterium]